MTTLLLARIALSAVATTLAAIAAERALRDVGRAGRAVWAGALLLTAAASALVVSGGRLPLPVPSRLSAWLSPADAPAGLIATHAVEAAPALDPLPYAWLALSLGIAALLAIGLLRQRLRLRAQPTARVSGVDVVVTRTLGPAVFGFLHPRIVVPDWLLDRPEEERRLVVEHEAEHIAARDPLLAAAGLLVVCLVPWNPFLWYQLRRLRLAIELDCDARVLRRGDARAYGRLLVDVADRLARGTPLATALAFPRNFLEWRIRMIVNRRTRPLRAAACALGAGVLLVAACADAADPVGMEAPSPETMPVEFEATLDPARADAERVLVEELRPSARSTDGLLTFRRTGETGGEVLRAGDLVLTADTLELVDQGRMVVPFRATLKADDTPAEIEFGDAITVEEERRLNAEMSQYRFRRSPSDPDAPVEGAVLVD